MDAHGAGDGSNSPRTYTEFASGFQGSFAQLGMGGQAEIIIGCQVDDPLAIKGTLRRLRVFEHAQLEMRALLFQIVHLVSEIRKLGAGSGGGHR